MIEKIVVVGAGQAAIQAIDVLRRRGFEGSIVLIGEESAEPYQRPPLSKQFLAGAWPAERLLLRPAQFYRAHQVDLLLGRKAVELDRHRACVILDDGGRVFYDRLLLATGSRARRLEVPGSELAGVHTLRMRADAEQLRAQLQAGRRLLVLGGGYIGLEVAATASRLGVEVTVLEAASRVLSRVAGAEISRFFQTEHVRNGVRIECAAEVEAFVGAAGGTRVAGVRCRDGREFPADLVLVGAGSVPAVELARSAGLECAQGIVVDVHCRTADERIFAAGDCACQPSLRYGYRVRLESVDNAYEQGTSAALNLLGMPTPHDRVPWFWSDQFDLKLIIVGLSQGADRSVLRGDPESRHFSVCYLRGDELLAIDTVNRPKEQMAARKLIGARARMSLERLAQPDIPLSHCVQ